jgi:F-type H+-transporting ATPase subunit delta
MSHNAENQKTGAVAENYAKALFSLTEAAGSTEQVLDELNAVASLVASEPDLAGLFAHKTLEIPRRAASIQKIFGGKLSDLTLKFLQVLNRKKRLTEVTHIRAAMDQMLKTRRGQVDVQVTSARPLDASQLANVAARLSVVLKKTAVVHPTVDASLIGGLKIRIQDKLIDASVASKIRRLSQKLTQTGVDKLRSRTADVITR